MRLSVGWLALLLLLLMSISLSCIGLSTVPSLGPALIRNEKKEGFTSLLNDLNISTCPANTTTFVDKVSGASMCCEGTIVDGRCNGRILCSLAGKSLGNSSPYPSCSDYMYALLEQKGAGRCPPGLPNYFENQRTGIRGCCASARMSDGSAPRDANDRKCRLYPTEVEERTRADSCYNAIGPASWPLSRFQEEFEKAGCVRRLKEEDVGWWRKQSTRAVLGDIGVYARLTAGCSGTRDQHEFCAPGKCIPPPPPPPPPAPIQRPAPVAIPASAPAAPPPPPQPKLIRQLTREEFQQVWDKTGCEGRVSLEPGQGWIRFTAEKLWNIIKSGAAVGDNTSETFITNLKGACASMGTTVPDTALLKDIPLDLFKDIWNQTGCEGKSLNGVRLAFATQGKFVKDSYPLWNVATWRANNRQFCSILPSA